MRWTYWLLVASCVTVLPSWNSGTARGDLLKIYDDYVIRNEWAPDGIWVYNDASVDMYSGEMTYDSVLFDHSRLNLFGGTIDGLYPHNMSSLYIIGGFVTDLCLWNESRVDLFVGGIVNLYCDPDTAVYIHAYDVVYDPSGGQWNLGVISGRFLLDDSSFTIDLATRDTYDQVHIVPEPASILMLLSGGLFMRFRRGRAG